MQVTKPQKIKKTLEKIPATLLLKLPIETWLSICKYSDNFLNIKLLEIYPKSVQKVNSFPVTPYICAIKKNYYKNSSFLWRITYSSLNHVIDVELFRKCKSINYSVDSISGSLE